jgi:hypothetical protein
VATKPRGTPVKQKVTRPVSGALTTDRHSEGWLRPVEVLVESAVGERSALAIKGMPRLGGCEGLICFGVEEDGY